LDFKTILLLFLHTHSLHLTTDFSRSNSGKKMNFQLMKEQLQGYIGIPNIHDEAGRDVISAMHRLVFGNPNGRHAYGIAQERGDFRCLVSQKRPDPSCSYMKVSINNQNILANQLEMMLLY
jgi:hypothetical protein